MSATDRFFPGPFHGRIALLLLAALSAGGCHVLPQPQVDPTHYYTLDGKADGATPAAGVSGGTLKIGLKPIVVPAYLTDRAMVVRDQKGEIHYEEYHRWAERLDDGIARLVRERLLDLPTVAAVYPPPFPIDETRDFDVTVEIDRCEGERDSTGAATAAFVATIEIARPGGDHEVVVRKKFTPPAAVWIAAKSASAQPNFGALANLLGDDVKAMANEIATALPATK
jgi:uncharacterized lipoprotein YmbA